MNPQEQRETTGLVVIAGILLFWLLVLCLHSCPAEIVQ